MKRNILPAIVSILVLGAGPIVAPPAVAAANPPQAYVECMDSADDKLEHCLDVAEETEVLCWSRFGYAKLWCSTKYLISSIFD